MADRSSEGNRGTRAAAAWRLAAVRWLAARMDSWAQGLARMAASWAQARPASTGPDAPEGSTAGSAAIPEGSRGRGEFARGDPPTHWLEYIRERSPALYSTVMGQSAQVDEPATATPSGVEATDSASRDAPTVPKTAELGMGLSGARPNSAPGQMRDGASQAREGADKNQRISQAQMGIPHIDTEPTLARDHSPRSTGQGLQASDDGSMQALNEEAEIPGPSRDARGARQAGLVEDAAHSQPSGRPIHRIYPRFGKPGDPHELGAAERSLQRPPAPQANPGEPPMRLSFVDQPPGPKPFLFPAEDSAKTLTPMQPARLQVGEGQAAGLGTRKTERGLGDSPVPATSTKVPSPTSERTIPPQEPGSAIPSITDRPWRPFEEGLARGENEGRRPFATQTSRPSGMPTEPLAAPLVLPEASTWRARLEAAKRREPEPDPWPRLFSTDALGDPLDDEEADHRAGRQIDEHRRRLDREQRGLLWNE